jgi:dihydroneopterin aldolase
VTKAILNIQKIKLEVKIGAIAEERQWPQLLLVDVIINFDELPKLAYTDDIADGLCYAKIVGMVRKFSVSREFNLIEHFAHMLAEELQKAFNIASLHIKVHKMPQIEGFEHQVCFEYITSTS